MYFLVNVVFYPDSREWSNIVINARVGERVVLPCTTQNTEMVWRFQQHCFSFEYQRPLVCAERNIVQYGNQFSLHRMTGNDKSLEILSVSQEMNGIFTCEKQNGFQLYSRVQLSVHCE